MNLQQLMKHVRALEITARHNVTELFAGNYKSSFRGHGIEFEDVREYEAGDDVRNIDWNITAREGKPFIKKYREERELSTFLMVDVSASMNFGTTAYLKREIAMQVAGILAFSILKNNDKIGCLAYSDQVEDYVPSKKGKAHMLHLLRTLFAAYEENKFKKSNLLPALHFFHRVSKRRNICFLITDSISPKAEKMLSITNIGHDLVIIRIADPFEENPPKEGVFCMQDPETRKMQEINLGSTKFQKKYSEHRIQKEKEFSRIIAKHSLDAITIRTDANVFQELFSFFQKRQQRF